MTTIKLQDHNPCPCCQRNLNAASSVGSDRKPKAGSVTVCAYCLTVLQFNDDMSYRLVTDAEFAEFPEEMQVKLGVIRQAARYAFQGSR